MTKFKLTLFNGLVVEHYAYSMIDAIQNVEKYYEYPVMKAEIAQFTSNKYQENECEFKELDHN